MISLAGNGDGMPDVLCGWRGRNLLIEIKRPGYEKKRGKRQAETLQRQTLWKLKWTGQYAIVTSPEEAVQFLEMQR